MLTLHNQIKHICRETIINACILSCFDCSNHDSLLYLADIWIYFMEIDQQLLHTYVTAGNVCILLKKHAHSIKNSARDHYISLNISIRYKGIQRYNLSIHIFHLFSHLTSIRLECGWLTTCILFPSNYQEKGGICHTSLICSSVLSIIFVF